MIVLKNNNYTTKDTEILHEALLISSHALQANYCNRNCETCKAKVPCGDLARAITYLAHKLYD